MTFEQELAKCQANMAQFKHLIVNRHYDPVKNVDLWQRMDALLQLHTVNCNWYKGHSGIVKNERCDTLANMGVNSL